METREMEHAVWVLGQIQKAAERMAAAVERIADSAEREVVIREEEARRAVVATREMKTAMDRGIGGLLGTLMQDVNKG